MVSRETLLRLLPAYTNTNVLLRKEQNTNDIINAIENEHEKYASDYDKISNLFWQGDPVSTAKYIYDYCKKNIAYCIEPDERQSVKSPSAIVATGIYQDGYNDCKHYSLFIAGILDSLRRQGYPISWKYRFANYKVFSTDPQHVFVVLNYNGNEYWIDPVLDNFDTRDTMYIGKIDKKINMALYALSGLPKKRIGLVADNSIDIPVNISVGAYIALVVHNISGTQDSLIKCLNYNNQSLSNYWTSLGWNYSDLVKISNIRFRSYKPFSSTMTNMMLAVSYPLLLTISQINPSDADAANIVATAANLLAGNAINGIGNILTDFTSAISSIANTVAPIANVVIPGSGAIIQAVTGEENNLAQGTTNSTTSALPGAQADIVNAVSVFNSSGLQAFYTRISNTGWRIANDGDTIFSNNQGSFYSSGLSLVKNFGGNLLDYCKSVVAVNPNGFDSGSSQYYSAVQAFISAHPGGYTPASIPASPIPQNTQYANATLNGNWPVGGTGNTYSNNSSLSPNQNVFNRFHNLPSSTPDTTTTQGRADQDVLNVLNILDNNGLQAFYQAISTATWRIDNNGDTLAVRDSGIWYSSGISLTRDIGGNLLDYAKTVVGQGSVKDMVDNTDLAYFNTLIVFVGNHTSYSLTSYAPTIPANAILPASELTGSFPANGSSYSGSGNNTIINTSTLLTPTNILLLAAVGTGIYLVTKKKKRA